MTVEGIGKQVYPELDVFEEVKPYFLASVVDALFAREDEPGTDPRHVPPRRRGSRHAVADSAEILDDLRRGDLTFITVNDKGHVWRALDRLGRRVFSGLVVSVCILFSGSYLDRAIVTPGARLRDPAHCRHAYGPCGTRALVAWLGRKRQAAEACRCAPVSAASALVENLAASAVRLGYWRLASSCCCSVSNHEVGVQNAGQRSSSRGATRLMTSPMDATQCSLTNTTSPGASSTSPCLSLH